MHLGCAHVRAVGPAAPVGRLVSGLRGAAAPQVRCDSFFASSHQNKLGRQFPPLPPLLIHTYTSGTLGQSSHNDLWERGVRGKGP